MHSFIRSTRFVGPSVSSPKSSFIFASSCARLHAPLRSTPIVIKLLLFVAVTLIILDDGERYHQRSSSPNGNDNFGRNGGGVGVAGALLMPIERCDIPKPPRFGKRNTLLDRFRNAADCIGIEHKRLFRSNNDNKISRDDDEDRNGVIGTLPQLPSSSAAVQSRATNLRSTSNDDLNNSHNNNHNNRNNNINNDHHDDNDNSDYDENGWQKKVLLKNKWKNFLSLINKAKYEPFSQSLFAIDSNPFQSKSKVALNEPHNLRLSNYFIEKSRNTPPSDTFGDFDHDRLTAINYGENEK